MKKVDGMKNSTIGWASLNVFVASYRGLAEVVGDHKRINFGVCILKQSDVKIF